MSHLSIFQATNLLSDNCLNGSPSVSASPPQPHTQEQYHELILPLPPVTEEQPRFQVAVYLQAASHKQAWLDNLEILGEPKYRKRHKTFLPFLTGETRACHINSQNLF